MNEVPGWIQLLYKRHTAGYALHTVFILNFTNEFIAGEADTQPNGREQLRKVALNQLESDNLQFVAVSLVCLGVVGHLDDLSAVEPFITHPSNVIRRAARACRFELGRKFNKKLAQISED